MLSVNRIFDLIKSGEIEFIDLKFCDLRGVWHHLTLSAKLVTLKTIEEGIGFDGSSIRGMQSVHASDMLLVPDKTTFFIDPFFEKTATCICVMYDPATRKPSTKDPRATAQNAEAYLVKSKIGTTSYWGPEIEFFVFNEMSLEFNQYNQKVELMSGELIRKSENYSSNGYFMRQKQGYFPASPFDGLQEYRSQVVRTLQNIGIEVEMHHHEVAAGGQVEIDLKYDTLVKMADSVMIYKYVARNVAKIMGLTAIFMAKPVYGDNGSGMHVHQSIFNKESNIFYDKTGYAEVSKKGLSYTGGLLKHINSLLAFTSPTVNSYRRLVPHFEAPTAVAFSASNRSAAVRIPMYFSQNERAKRLEFRCPDPMCNPYLSFAAQQVAGIQGIKDNLDPVTLGFGPFDENIWEKEGVAQTPNNLFDAIDSLKKDDIYVKSGVFSHELVKSYIDLKEKEAIQVGMHPSPADFYYYSDI